MSVESKKYAKFHALPVQDVMHSCEISPKKTKRRLTAEYKLKILAEAESCTKSGEIGALLRREGLYSSSLTKWRQQRDSGILKSLSGKKRGAKSKKDPAKLEIVKLMKEKSLLEARLKQAETVIEFQKKACEIFGVMPHPILPNSREIKS